MGYSFSQAAVLEYVTDKLSSLLIHPGKRVVQPCGVHSRLVQIEPRSGETMLQGSLAKTVAPLLSWTFYDKVTCFFVNCLGPLSIEH